MSSQRHSCSCIFLLLLSHFLNIAVNCLEGSYFFYQQPEYPRDCKEVYEQCSSDNSSGVHTIKPDGYLTPFEVYCDNEISTGGWTVIHRQIDGSLTFKRTWENYRNGFGFLSREFYIGNDKLSHLTNQAVYELRIDMMLSNGSHFYIRYDRFRIGDEWSQYTLIDAEEFSGNSSCVATSCPIEMEHERCACQTSCKDPVRMTDCYEICEETCVPKGCFVNEANAFILEGESYSDPACTKNCSCSYGQLTCDNSYHCDVNAVCENRTNSHKCYCNEGFRGNGVTCQSICPTNEIFGTCTCQKSCSNPTSCVSCSGRKTCYCPNGFYLQGGNCVPPDSCGCYMDGHILSNGETYVNSDCSRRCTCNNNQLNCELNYQCTSNAACTARGGVRQCYCNDGYKGDGVTSCRLYTDCNDVQAPGRGSGVYAIKPRGWPGSPFNVFCNMTIDGGGWTVIQRRKNGLTGFYRNWDDYKNGFGNIREEFWLGNEKIYYLTQQADYEYRFDSVLSSLANRYHKYTRFRIDNESNKYRVTNVGTRSGNGGNTLYGTQNIAFSTYNEDNDGKSATNCAEGHQSGWWHGGNYGSSSVSRCIGFPEGSRYRYCSTANPNGVYNGGNGRNIFPGISSDPCHTKYTEMKIRRIS